MEILNQVHNFNVHAAELYIETSDVETFVTTFGQKLQQYLNNWL